MTAAKVVTAQDEENPDVEGGGELWIGRGGDRPAG